MKQEIEAALQPLIGQPLSDMWRYAGCQKFEFGVQRPAKNRKGQDVKRADWGLVVSCDWRVMGPEGHVVSSDDFGPGRSRRDEQAKPFYELIHTDPPVVEGIEANTGGALRIRMSQGYTLDVQPETDSGSDDEQRRFLPRDPQQKYFVLWGDGIEEGEMACPE